MFSITPYRRSIRPVQPESFPRYVEQELDKVGKTAQGLVEAVQSIDTSGTGSGTLGDIDLGTFT